MRVAPLAILAMAAMAVLGDQGVRSRSLSPSVAAEDAGSAVGHANPDGGTTSGRRVERRVVERHQRLGALRWSDEEEAVLARAERLRLSGRGATAANVVATGCKLPVGFRTTDHELCGQLDLARWYEALTGEPWDGAFPSLHRAQDQNSYLEKESTTQKKKKRDSRHTSRA